MSSNGLGLNETIGWTCGACEAVNEITRGTCVRCMTSVTYSTGMGQMTAATRSGAGASRKMLAVDKTKTMDSSQLLSVKHDIERFCRLMERGLEVDLPSTNSIRVLFIDHERSALHIASNAAEVFAAEMAIKFENVIRVVALTEVEHSSRVLIRHKDKGQVVDFEFDVDTNKSRDILTDMISKLVSVYSKKKSAMNEEVTITGALTSLVNNFSLTSLWGGNADTDKPIQAKATYTSGSAASAAKRSAAYRRQVSNEGRDLFRSSMDENDFQTKPMRI